MTPKKNILAGKVHLVSHEGTFAKALFSLGREAFMKAETITLDTRAQGGDLRFIKNRSGLLGVVTLETWKKSTGLDSVSQCDSSVPSCAKSVSL